MKSILNVLVVLLALYGAYMLYDNYAPDTFPRFQPESRVEQAVPSTETTAIAKAKPEGKSSKDSPKKSSKSATNKPSAKPRASIEVVHLICPSCDGEGRLTYADRKGANHSYSCPICNTMGSRDIVLKPGQSICPDCKGWGRTEKIETRSGVGGPILERGRGGYLSKLGIPGYKISASTCRRCNFTGVIATELKKPADATPGVQTPRSGR